MERIQISTKLVNFFSDRVDDQLSDLEAQSMDILDQAIALEKQSQRILDSLED